MAIDYPIGIDVFIVVVCAYVFGIGVFWHWCMCSCVRCGGRFFGSEVPEVLRHFKFYILYK